MGNDRADAIPAAARYLKHGGAPRKIRAALFQLRQGTEAEQTPEQAVLAEYRASLHGPGRPLSQRYLAEKYGIDRRKVKQIITGATSPLD